MLEMWKTQEKLNACINCPQVTALRVANDCAFLNELTLHPRQV